MQMFMLLSNPLQREFILHHFSLCQFLWYPVGGLCLQVPPAAKDENKPTET